MRIAPPVATIVVGVAALVLAGCEDSASDPYARDERFIASNQLDTDTWFDSLAELLAYQGGPLVVIGEVEWRDSPEPEEDATPSRFMGFTESKVRVSEVVLPGSGEGYEPVEAGDLLEIRQWGNPTQEFRVFRLLKEDEPVLLFLVTDGSGPWGIAGPEGHYRIEDGRLEQGNYSEDHPLGAWLDDLPPREAVSKIRAQAAALP